MRSPPARRSRSPYYRSAGHRLFSLRMTSRGRSRSSGFEWDSNFVRCLILLSWMTSCTAGIPRSLWIISLVKYRGASTIALNILDWHLCMTAIFDLLAKPHNSMPYVHIGVMMDDIIIYKTFFKIFDDANCTWSISHNSAGCGIQNAVNRSKRGPEASSNETQPIIRSTVVRSTLIRDCAFTDAGNTHRSGETSVLVAADPVTDIKFSRTWEEIKTCYWHGNVSKPFNR